MFSRRTMEEDEQEFDFEPPGYRNSDPESPEEDDDHHHHHRRTCGKGHRSSLTMETSEGGMICLVCFSALLSDPRSPSHHVSYALSQLSLATRRPDFLRRLRSHHAHLLVSPLVRALSSFAHDDALAHQALDLISDLCHATGFGSDSRLAADFVARIADCLSSSSAAVSWSRRQIYLLHCFGILLNSHQDGNPTTYIRDKAALFSNLVASLQLPSEEIRGEVFFVLYRLFMLHATPWDAAAANDDDGDADSSITGMGLQLLNLSLEALLKTQDTDVQINCLALLMILAKRGFFAKSFANDQSGSDLREADNLMQTNGMVLQTPLINLFADAIKGPLLSSDAQVQLRTLEFIFHCLVSDIKFVKHIEALVEENIADYVFEILRQSGNEEPMVISCLQILDILAMAEESFRQRLAIGFPTLLSVLHYVADIPLHPVQNEALKLVWSCISNCPGIISISQVEEIALVLTGIFRRHNSGQMGMFSQAFILACSTFVEILKSPSSTGMQKIAALVQETSRNMVLSSLSVPEGKNSQLMLYSLYFLKEAHIYSLGESFNTNSNNIELEKCIVEICKAYLLPWLERAIDEGEEEEVVLDVLETFHLILLKGSEVQALNFAEALSSSSWFTLSFGCLGLFPSSQMKTRIYLMLSSILDRAVAPEFGQPIRDAYVNLPPDPLELLFLLGQKSSYDPDLISCQRSVLLMLYVSSLYGESLADDNQVLAMLEQFILVNGSNFLCGIADSVMLTQLVHLYGLVRGALVAHRTPYSSEAEKAFFCLLAEREWEILSMGVHPITLQWLFQQEAIIAPLSDQILNFCKLYSTNKTQINVHATKIQIMDIHTIAELVVSGDNNVTLLLVLLLKGAQEEGRDDDTLSVVNVIAEILKIYPGASDQFFLHGIGNALRSGYYSIDSSSQNFIACSLLVFNILYSVNHKTISEDGEWVAITVKLLEFINPKLTSSSCGREGHLVIGIFCLILHHSTNQVLKESSTAILLNKSLANAVESIVRIACAKGPALVDHDDETDIGECLIFVLLLYFFSLKSLHAVLLGTPDWQNFFQPSDEVQSLPVLCIKCQDLCRLMYFGSSPVKLVASQCLVELLTRVSDQSIRNHDELRCSFNTLESMMAVTEGLVFYENNTVAINCGICCSILLGWDKVGLPEKKAIKDSKWCRLISEELAMTLAAPRLVSKGATNQHKPAAHIVTALLRLEEFPVWMRSVFDVSCISGIIDNLSSSTLSTEMVRLFRALLLRKYLSTDQIACLHHLFQLCRKQAYSDTPKEQHFRNLCSGKGVVIPDDTGKACSLLIQLMLSPAMSSNGIQTAQKRLLEEIDLFFQESCTQP